MVDGIHTVRKGDCPWNVAKASLKAQSKEVSSAAIAKEMQRLATLNGCKDIDDFGSKFFNSTGKEIKLTDDQKKPEAPAPKPQRAKLTARPDSTALRDSLARDSATIHKPDSTYVAKNDATMVSTKDSTRIMQDSTRVAKNDSTAVQAQKQPVQTEEQKINSMKDDKQKIIEYNKKHAKGNYVIVDKKTCRATVYNKAGQALESYEVLLGSAKGDNMSTAVAANPKEIRNTTVPGEYTLSFQTSEHGMTLMMGDSMETMDPDMQVREWAPGFYGKKKFNGIRQAIHGTADRKNRDKLYNDGNLANNRVSMGCVNIPLEDLQEMKQKYGVGVNSKLYILPEDKGNSLKLETQADGTTKFVTQYANKEQNNKRVRVQNQIAQGKIQRQLRAKQRAEQQRLLAEQKAQKEKEENFRWYNPATWYIS